jgi:hypothetical protein
MSGRTMGGATKDESSATPAERLKEYRTLQSDYPDVRKFYDRGDEHLVTNTNPNIYDSLVNDSMNIPLMFNTEKGDNTEGMDTFHTKLTVKTLKNMCKDGVIQINEQNLIIKYGLGQFESSKQKNWADKIRIKMWKYCRTDGRTETGRVFNPRTTLV